MALTTTGNCFKEKAILIGIKVKEFEKIICRNNVYVYYYKLVLSRPASLRKRNDAVKKRIKNSKFITFTKGYIHRRIQRKRILELGF